MKTLFIALMLFATPALAANSDGNTGQYTSGWGDVGK